MGLSKKNDIEKFNFLDTENTALSVDVIGTIDKALRTVRLIVPAAAVITALKPDIAVSLGATISPLDGVVRNFTNPLTYTVTAEDGITTQVWTVTVTKGNSDQKIITKFNFLASENVGVLTENITGVIDVTNRAVYLEVYPNTVITALKPDISVTAFATISPADGVVQNFTKVIDYTVTAQNATTNVYRVTVKKSKKAVKPIKMKYTVNEADGVF
jgi:hypothetical protein